MISGNIHNLGNIRQWLPAPLQEALDCLLTVDFAALRTGRHELRGDDIFFQVIDLTTKPADENRPEVHRNYIDVQFLVHGSERIGFATDDGTNIVAQDLLKERDLLFYQDVRNESWIEMIPGSFAVFFPTDVHRPACMLDAPTPIRKVVVKVKLAQL
ncbi:hypothetical protein AZL_b00270 (plasmid) [Azospirillum sp. B510]|uniref:YhcH/YjgK/YiaL family protein n=1 Tax=Azospirillum sp. (strain B510) TaxID=137722 RepID=UPI0001C4C9A8|nr:YhcH/YjgK/YiaL family protein [Azospirillum sp. B510]BAI74690.1 hypothetical protein AZL_b00270 [Azospirillum sp. B510]